MYCLFDALTVLAGFFFPVSIDTEDDIREFVKAKIESLVANFQADNEISPDTETSRFKSATVRFHRLFNMQEEERLVNCEFDDSHIERLRVINVKFLLQPQQIYNITQYGELGFS